MSEGGFACQPNGHELPTLVVASMACTLASLPQTVSDDSV